MKKYLLIAAATLSLAACNNDDNIIDEPVAVRISATIGTTLSRATDISWSEDDSIGITMEERYVNIKYTTGAGNGIFTGETMYFKNKRESVNLTAYYPFTGDEGTSQIIEAYTGTSFQTPETQPAIDFLYASKENVSGEDPNVAFQFSHQMSKLTLKFINGLGANGIRIVSYRVDGLILEGTFDTTTGGCTASTDASTEPLEISVNGEADGVQLSSLILFPQTVGNKKLTLSITDNDGQYYACDLTFEDDIIAAGNNYLFTVTVNKTGLNVNKSTITDWVTKESSGGASSVVDPDK